MPGIGLFIEGAMQQAPQPSLQVMVGWTKGTPMQSPAVEYLA